MQGLTLSRRQIYGRISQADNGLDLIVGQFVDESDGLKHGINIRWLLNKPDTDIGRHLSPVTAAGPSRIYVGSPGEKIW